MFSDSFTSGANTVWGSAALLGMIVMLSSIIRDIREMNLSLPTVWYKRYYTYLKIISTNPVLVILSGFSLHAAGEWLHRSYWNPWRWSRIAGWENTEEWLAQMSIWFTTPALFLIIFGMGLVLKLKLAVWESFGGCGIYCLL